MTAAWAKGHTKRYRDYWLQARGCSEYRKSIRAEKIETGFEAILRTLTPSKRLIEIAGAMRKDAWGQREDQAKHAKSALKRQITDLNQQQDALLERLGETTNSKVSGALEAKIAQLDADRLRLNDKMERDLTPKGATLDEIFELLRVFLSSPWNIYENGTLQTKKTILKTAFKAPLAYDRETGFRTPQASVIFEFFRENHSKM